MRRMRRDTVSLRFIVPFFCFCMIGLWGVADAGRPQHLVEELLAAKREHPPVALDLLREDWKFEGVSAKETAEGWELESEGGVGTMSLAKELDASNYTTLLVEMKTEAGSICTLAWAQEEAGGAESVAAMPSFSYPILSGVTFQEYKLRFSERADKQWVGRILRLLFTPTDHSGKVEIRRMELRYEPEFAMRRMEIQGVEREVLFGQQESWKVCVPEEGVLETHIGFHKKAYEGELQGTLEARVVLEHSNGAQELAYSRRLSPFLVEEHKDWVPVRVDLSEYAGKDLWIRLEVDPLGSRRGDWVYWGSPMVFSLGSQPEATPVILISLDTMRADHMSVYGYERDTTPRLAAWAKEEAVVFETAITPQSWTLPAHMSMLTGMIPPHHGVISSRNLPESVVTLPEQLRSIGYLCAGFTGHNWWLLGRRGFGQGFDVYDTPVPVMRHIYDTDARLQTWLDGHPVRNLFLFFHCYDVHSKLQNRMQPWNKNTRNPYDSGDAEYQTFSKGLVFPDAFMGDGAANVGGDDILQAYNNGQTSFQPEEHALLKALYDDCVSMVDQTVFDIFESLKRRGLYENSLIIITSDHGENLGEHKQYSHLGVYEEEVHVPLIVRFPNKAHAGERYEKMVSTVSIYPTVIDVLGLVAPHAMDGPSLLGVIDGSEAASEFVYVGRGGAVEGPYDKVVKGVRTQDWKLRWEATTGDAGITLFNVHEQPEERTNYLQEQPEIAMWLGGYLKEFLYSQDGWHVFAQNNSDKEEMNLRLKSQGKIVEVLLAQNGGAFEVLPMDSDGFISFPVKKETTVHLIVKTEPTEATLELDASADFSYSLAIGDLIKNVEGGVSATYAQGDVGEEQPTGAKDPNKSVLGVWYEGTEGADGAAPQASQEMEESLKALGYLN